MSTTLSSDVIFNKNMNFKDVCNYHIIKKKWQAKLRLINTKYRNKNIGD